MNGLLEVFMQRKEELLQLFIQHMEMTSIAVLLSICIGIPVGILIIRQKTVANIVIGIANLMQSIPSIGLLAFLVPIVGIGQRPAIIMVIIYALLPIIKNTYIGITGIEASTMESAKAIGLPLVQTLFKVQIPLAMPYIMAGIRISAVTAVGTVTIAAFAGAGGLGWFIDLGLNANDGNLVLLGAIPACILALLIDFLLGKIETALTPEGLKTPDRICYHSKQERKKRICWSVTVFFLIFLLPCLYIVGENLKSDEKKVVVGSENFTESLILGNIYSLLIQNNTDLQVEEKFNLNGTMLTMSAMKSGEIDMFTDYTGVLAPNVLDLGLSTDMDQVYKQVKNGMEDQYNMQVSEPIGFSNTYVFAVSRETSEKYGITKVSDLLKHAGELRLGCTTAFTQREDLLPKLTNEYGVSFAEVTGLEGNIRYQAIRSGKVDVIDAYETDALLKESGLVTLKDDIGFFPPYQAVAIVRNEVLDKYSELEDVLSKLDGAISTQEMMEMNYQVDVEGKTPEETARTFLEEKGLID